MNSSVKPKVPLKLLLDTTYLLPVVGVDVEDIHNTLKALQRLFHRRKIQLHCTPFNLMELLAKLSKTTYDEERVLIGLESMRKHFTVTHPTVKGYVKALKLRKEGFRDFIDLLLYTTAVTRQLRFLTRDEDLKNFLKSRGENVECLLSERELERLVNTL